MFNEVRNKQNYEEWIIYLLRGIEVTSKETINLIEKIQDACSATKITVTSYLNQLEKVGLMESEKIGREKIYKNIKLIKILSEN